MPQIVRASICGIAAVLLPSSPMGAQDPAPGAQVSAVAAAELYADACAPCHGRLGEGNGRGAARLGSPEPRDFTVGVFKFRTTPTGSLPTDADIFRTIARGVPSTWMPAWEDLLSEDETWAIVRYVKGFSEFFAIEDPDPPVPLPTPLEVTPELLSEGRLVYTVLGCARCHGTSGRGDGPSAAELTDDWDREIVPYDFTRGGYKNGSTPSDIYRTLVTGLDGTPMPAFEPDAVVFPGDPEGDVTSLSTGLDARTAEELEAYLRHQPTAEQISAMDSDERERLAQHRLWALVFYLDALQRPRRWWYRLLVEQPELTREKGR